ncbi:MAG TPA: cytochrome c-type biogenesis protein CcmH [Acidimicrobiales bacterium]|nr:cytochrome c-type biogenesis protein CcmH [Acidimicrobiales bacterium]
MSGRALRRWLPYVLLVPVVCVALLVGAGGDDAGPVTPGGRASRLAGQVRCPTCEGLSAAESESSASVAIRAEIRRRIDAGATDEEVRAFLVGRYGRDILLTPEGSGIAGLVWALPVAVLVLGAGGLALSFRRRRAAPTRTATAADRLLVDQALGR